MKPPTGGGVVSAAHNLQPQATMAQEEQEATNDKEAAKARNLAALECCCVVTNPELACMRLPYFMCKDGHEDADEGMRYKEEKVKLTKDIAGFVITVFGLGVLYGIADCLKDLNRYKAEGNHSAATLRCLRFQLCIVMDFFSGASKATELVETGIMPIMPTSDKEEGAPPSAESMDRSSKEEEDTKPLDAKRLA